MQADLVPPLQRYDEAERVLIRLRKLPVEHEYLQWELKQTRAQVEAENLVRGDDTLWDVTKAVRRVLFASQSSAADLYGQL